MKNRFIFLLITTGITLTFLSSPNLAQSGCTFIGQDGKPVDLGNLCEGGNSNSNDSNSQPSNSSDKKPKPTEKITIPIK